MKDIIVVPFGTNVTYSYESNGGTVTITGVKTREIGSNRLGNSGFAIVQNDGEIRYISRYAYVTVNA